MTRNIFELRQGVVNDVANNMPGLPVIGRVAILPHAGRFTSEELDRIGAKAPCIFISTGMLANVGSDSLGDNAEVAFTAIIVTKDIPKIKRDASSMALANIFAVHLTENTWGMDESRRYPEKINGRNLYASKLDKKGIAMWGFTWSQWMTIGGIADTTDLASFITYHAEHSLVPGGDEPAAIDQVTLPQ